MGHIRFFFQDSRLEVRVDMRQQRSQARSSQVCQAVSMRAVRSGRCWLGCAGQWALLTFRVGRSIRIQSCSRRSFRYCPTRVTAKNDVNSLRRSICLQCFLKSYAICSSIVRTCVAHKGFLGVKAVATSQSEFWLIPRGSLDSLEPHRVVLLQASKR